MILTVLQLIPGKREAEEDGRFTMENCTLQASFPQLDVILATSGEGEEILAVLECLFFNQKLLSYVINFDMFATA